MLLYNHNKDLYAQNETIKCLNIPRAHNICTEKETKPMLSQTAVIYG